MPVAVSCELSEVGIRHLPMPHDSPDFYVGERQIVGPELVPRRILDSADDLSGCGRGSTRPQQESDKTALGEGARGEFCV